ncbi:MAG: class I SAM-dependent methyltransferase family protein [Candidatus Methanomethylophilus sp.]|nr:class I SAM-dependent methyltransferase family protein [Methanomethylophilus sp.]
MKQVPEVLVPAERTAELIPLLLARGIADPEARITAYAGGRRVPVRPERQADAAAMGLTVVTGPAYSEASRPPLERIKELLQELTPAELDRLPEKWETAGSAVTLKLDPVLVEHGAAVGRAYAAVLGAKAVMADISGVAGEFRLPDMQVLYGVPGESVKTENGIHYCFDPTAVMFASGNINERRRMGELDCRGETVVDMFAGIGYFTLPLAKFAGPRRLFACEKNPRSYESLCKNLKLNGVADTVIPILADNRSLLGTGFADRILMGYIQKTADFLPTALRLAKSGCIIHYHDTFYVGQQEMRVREIFDAACGKRLYEVLAIQEVKSFAPSVSHYVADVKVG